jgi:hypothetical protein
MQLTHHVFNPVTGYAMHISISHGKLKVAMKDRSGFILEPGQNLLIELSGRESVAVEITTSLEAMEALTGRPAAMD